MAGEGIIVSTSYLPPCGYVSAILKASEFFIELYETYPKQTFRNHACIYGPNGKQILSIPVTKPGGNHTLTKDVLIANSQSWQRIHWRAIETAYSNSPYFLYYQDYFRPFYEKPFELLADFNAEILLTVFRLLQFDADCRFTGSYEKHPSSLADHRNDLTSKHASALCPVYTQTFSERHGFIPNLSVLDLIFNLGPEAKEYLLTVAV